MSEDPRDALPARPGPWQAYGGAEVLDTRGRVVCTLPSSLPDDVSARSDARLIAAAPELLEACRLTLDLLSDMVSEDFARGADRPAREALEAAIHRATRGRL